jgi:uncharacterized membrane protein
MHTLYEFGLRLFDWLTMQGAERATVVLVLITACNVFLTHRMAKAMNRQTRAMIQPVLASTLLSKRKSSIQKDASM